MLEKYCQSPGPHSSCLRNSLSSQCVVEDRLGAFANLNATVYRVARAK
jgi:hypothetical protein